MGGREEEGKKGEKVSIMLDQTSIESWSIKQTALPLAGAE